MQLLFHPYLQLSNIRIPFTPRIPSNNSLNPFILLKKLNIGSQKIPKNYCAKTKKLYICTRNKCSLNKGEIPKWPTGADCNSADIVFVGSNPALPTTAEIAQSIEHQPSKLGVAGLSPVFRSHFKALTIVGAFLISGSFSGFHPPHVNLDVNRKCKLNAYECNSQHHLL